MKGMKRVTLALYERGTDDLVKSGFHELASEIASIGQGNSERPGDILVSILRNNKKLAFLGYPFATCFFLPSVAKSVLKKEYVEIPDVIRSVARNYLFFLLQNREWAGKTEERRLILYGLLSVYSLYMLQFFGPSLFFLVGNLSTESDLGNIKKSGSDFVAAMMLAMLEDFREKAAMLQDRGNRFEVVYQNFTTSVLKAKMAYMDFPIKDATFFYHIHAVYSLYQTKGKGSKFKKSKEPRKILETREDVMTEFRNRKKNCKLLSDESMVNLAADYVIYGVSRSSLDEREDFGDAGDVRCEQGQKSNYSLSSELIDQRTASNMLSDQKLDWFTILKKPLGLDRSFIGNLVSVVYFDRIFNNSESLQIINPDVVESYFDVFKKMTKGKIETNVKWEDVYRGLIQARYLTTRKK